MKIYAHAFDPIYNALMHLKIMRVFIDAVLRFGLPKESKFFMCIIKPSNNNDKNIMKKLTEEFAEEHLKDYYGEKQEAQDEDFFPYVLTQLSSPLFLMS